MRLQILQKEMKASQKSIGSEKTEKNDFSWNKPPACLLYTSAFLGKEIDYSAIAPAAGNSTAVKVSVEEEKEIKFGYCTEFIILLEKEFTENDEHELKAYLSSIGDSIVCVACLLYTSRCV